jgi:DNA-binding ferritin-like protein
MTDSVKMASVAAEIEKSLRTLLADVFALYVKTKNFHWHMSVLTSGTTTFYWTSREINSSP